MVFLFDVFIFVETIFIQLKKWYWTFPSKYWVSICMEAFFHLIYSCDLTYRWRRLSFKKNIHFTIGKMFSISLFTSPNANNIYFFTLSFKLKVYKTHKLFLTRQINGTLTDMTVQKHLYEIQVVWQSLDRFECISRRHLCTTSGTRIHSDSICCYPNSYALWVNY